MYLLMNKNTPVALFHIVSDDYAADKRLELLQTYGKLPINTTNLNEWAETRKAYKHSRHLKQLVTKLGGDDIENYINLTHLASINDTFWMKNAYDDTSWDRISLYRNQFSEAISMLAFGTTCNNDIGLSTTSPELTCDGSFAKCFRKEKIRGQFGSDIFIYKRGGEIGQGIEPYCEILASELANHISPHNSVSYSIKPLHQKLASCCNLFTNEQIGYAAYARITDLNNISLSAALRYYENIGSEEQFREMIVVDALCFNEDRHAGNYGVLFDNDTLEIKKMAPIFDLNVTFFRNAVAEDFSHIGDYMYHISPKLGDDFTKTGHFAANSTTLQDRIKDVKDFSFSFRGDETFSPERVTQIETIVRKQAAAILSDNCLKTTDVFFSQEEMDSIKKQNETKAAEKRLNKFMKILDNMGLDNDIFVSRCCSTDNVQCFVEKDDAEIVIDFLTNKITPYLNAKAADYQTICDADSNFARAFAQISKQWAKFNTPSRMEQIAQTIANNALQSSDSEYEP